MIWVVGTGRCGTKSAASQFNGVHEPPPWFGTETMEYRKLEATPRSLTSREDRIKLENLHEFISGRIQSRHNKALERGDSCISDFKHSFVVPIIREIDPNPEFVFLMRNPFPTAISFLVGIQKHKWHTHLLRFYNASPLTAIVMHYNTVNQELMNELNPLSKRVRVIFTPMLEKHINKHPESKSKNLSEEEKEYIRQKTKWTWQRMMRYEQTWFDWEGR